MRRSTAEPAGSASDGRRGRPPSRSVTSSRRPRVHDVRRLGGRCSRARDASQRAVGGAQPRRARAGLRVRVPAPRVVGPREVGARERGGGNRDAGRRPVGGGARRAVCVVGPRLRRAVLRAVRRIGYGSEFDGILALARDDPDAQVRALAARADAAARRGRRRS